MYIEELTCKPERKSITVSFSYDEIRDISNGLFIVASNTKSGYDFSDIYGKVKFLFDMIKHGDIQPETVRRLDKSTLTDEEIDIFNAYIKDNDMPTAFGNSDWCNVYDKIVGDKKSEYAEEQRIIDEYDE